MRRDLPYDTFAQRWREAQRERTDQASALEAGLREDPQLGERARMTLADGKSADLVREAEGWRLEVPLMSPLRAGNPQDALRMLAAALEQRSFEATMRVLTSTRRDGFKGELEAFLAGLKAHIGTEIEVSGERAFLRWTDGAGKVRWKVTLIRENGEWRVDDVTRQ